MRPIFDAQLELLHKKMITMGALCENAIARSSKAAIDADIELAKTVTAVSQQIVESEREIEALCMRLLLKQQPVAADLREISSALKMITDMERIGRQSADIADIVRMGNIKGGGHTKPVSDMAQAVIKMVTDSIDAYVKKDAAIAEAVIAYDDVADNCFDEIKRLLIDSFSMPQCGGEQAVDLLMIAKYLERIGDHAVNIAKWVVFSITGSRE